MEKSQSIVLSETTRNNRSLLFFYLAPYALYVTIPMAIESQELIYTLRLLLVPLVLLFCWKKYIPLNGPNAISSSVIIGAATGILGCALWIALTIPFVPKEMAAQWSPQAFALRLAAATLIVPIFEELLVRGYLFLLVLQWQTAKKKGSHSPLSEALDDCDVGTVEPGAWSVTAILISTLLFASGHQVFEWPAAVVYGLLLSMLWIVRKDMISLISAHAVTNFCLALYVFYTGNWGIW